MPCEGRLGVQHSRLHFGGGSDLEYGAVRRFSFLRPGRCWVAKHVPPPGAAIWSSLVVGRHPACAGPGAVTRTSFPARHDGPCDSGNQILFRANFGEDVVCRS
jgi:hypothetical protein